MWKKLKELLTRKPKEEVLEEKELIFRTLESMQSLDDFYKAKEYNAKGGTVVYRIVSYRLILDKDDNEKEYRATVQKVLIRP